MKYIYVIAESLDGPCKIGIAGNPADRLSQMQSGNPRKLALFFTAEIEGCRPHSLERMAHSLASVHRRLIGEWFDITVSDAIAAVTEAGNRKHEFFSVYDGPMAETKPPSELYLSRRKQNKN